MPDKKYECIVIGAGAAGLAAAISLAGKGVKTAVIEREVYPGGILMQCIHSGFGLIEFKEELTGPEYAERFIDLVNNEKNIDLYLDTTVIDIQNSNDEYKSIFFLSRESGFTELKSQVVIFAAGSRERNRGNLGIGGSRPAGVFTAGLVQRYCNLLGYIPGEKIIILGSGDIGLIMARRLTWAGAEVSTVLEINPFPSGLPRNISQCLNDFNIPLLLNHTVTEIIGRDRIEGVRITPLENGQYMYNKSFIRECDTLLLSVGLIPENELLKRINIKINPDTNGPYVDSSLMTSVPGIFSCGNCLHIHDIVDFVSDEGRRAGQSAINYLNRKPSEHEYTVTAGANIKYIIPNKFSSEKDGLFYFRPLILKTDAVLEVYLNDKLIKTVKKGHVHPAEMILLKIRKEEYILQENRDNQLIFNLK